MHSLVVIPPFMMAQSPGAGGTQANPIVSMAPLILMFVVLYFLMIRPQSKQRKQHQELLKTLKKGDEVVTTAGIHGKIAGVADTLITLEIAENVRVKMDRQQVATIKAGA